MQRIVKISASNTMGFKPRINLETKRGIFQGYNLVAKAHM
jgi:hypothetical protein